MKEGFPIIRYRTRDIASLTTEPCSCGRTSARMSRVSGRTDDMLIIRGVNVFPSQVESILLDIGQTEPHYVLVVDRINNLDVLTVQVEVSASVFESGSVRKLEQVEHSISAALASGLGISVNVKLVEPKSLERSQGKAKRVIDNRKI
jgi:phenylacetate-CoA ligase